MIKSNSLSLIGTSEFSELAQRTVGQYRYDAYVVSVQTIGQNQRIKSSIPADQFREFQNDSIVEFSRERNGAGLVFKQQISASSMATYPLSSGDCVAFLQEKCAETKKLGKLFMAKRSLRVVK